MKHLKFIIGCIFIPFWNLRQKLKGKWVYINISHKQLWYIIYRDMDRIEAANHIKKKL